MFRKTIAAILCFLLVFCLFVGCGAKKETPEKTTEETVAELETTAAEQTQQESEKLLDIKFSTKDVQKMSNWKNDNYYVSNGVWSVLGVDKIQKKYGMSTSKSGSEESLICEKFCYSITIIDEWIYCCARVNGSETNSIIKIRISGSGEKTLVEPQKNCSIGEMMIYDSMIYFTEYNLNNNNGSTLYCCDLNGKNRKTVIDKKIYEFYIIGDTVLYTDFETMRLHTCTISGENEKLLVDDWVMNFIYDGSKLFYLGFKENMTRKEFEKLDDLYKCVIKCVFSENEKGEIIVSNASSLTDIAIDDEYIYYGNYDDSSRLYRVTKDGKKTMLVSKDTYVEDMLLYGDSIIYIDLKKEKGDLYYFEKVVCSDKNGDNKVLLNDLYN